MNNELELSVKKLELGTLTTNAIAVRDKVKELLNNYKAENYNENNIDKAKEDKALLNNTSKKLNDERIRLEKEFTKPFNDFKDIVTETTLMIKDASAKIDVIVKEVEDKAKEQRKEIITNIFNELVRELSVIISLEMIFDDKWLNKGSFNDNSDFKQTSEIESKLNKIRTELEAIKNLKSEHELSLTNQYLKTFNLGEVIIENNRLNELKANTQIFETAKVVEKERVIDEIVNTKIETNEDDMIKTYQLEIKGTVKQLEQLKEFLKLNKMETKNIETGKQII